MLTVTSGKGLDALSAWSDAGGASAAVSNAQGACLRRRLATEQRRVHLVLEAPADWLGAAREAARTAFASELAARLSMRAPYDEVVVEEGAMVARRPASRVHLVRHASSGQKMEGSFTPEQVAKIFAAKFTLKPGELELVYAPAATAAPPAADAAAAASVQVTATLAAPDWAVALLLAELALPAQPLLDLCTRHGVKIWAASVAQPAPPPAPPPRPNASRRHEMEVEHADTPLLSPDFLPD